MSHQFVLAYDCWCSKWQFLWSGGSQLPVTVWDAFNPMLNQLQSTLGQTTLGWTPPLKFQFASVIFISNLPWIGGGFTCRNDLEEHPDRTDGLKPWPVQRAYVHPLLCALSPIKTVYRATGASLNPASSRRLHKRKLLIPHVRGLVLSRSHRVIYSLPGGPRYISETRPCYFIRASCWAIHFRRHLETFKVHLQHNNQLILLHYSVLLRNTPFVSYICVKIAMILLA